MPPDEVLVVETPEQTRLEYPLAGVGSRFVALAIDTLLQLFAGIVLVAIALLFTVTGSLGGRMESFAGGPWAVAILTLFWFVVQFGYYAGFESAWGGQTPGKRKMGLRVIKRSGRPIEPHEALTRNLMRMIDVLPVGYGVGILSVLFSPSRQRLGDLAAGTVVVHERTYDVAPFDWSLEPSATAPGHACLEVLTREELVAVETFLQRRTAPELQPEVREQLAGDLAARIAARLGTPPEERPQPEPWLEELARRSREIAGYR